MGHTKLLFETKGFRGKNNLSDPARVLPAGKGSFLTASLNVDIDDALMAHRRAGFASSSYSGSAIHSLWGNGDVCLFVQGSDLKRLNADYSAATLRAGIGTGRMNYVEVNGIIYYTNDAAIGFVKDGVDKSFTDPLKTYKTPMGPGHLIEYFNSRIYVARDNTIWFSDPVALGRTDMRRNFKQLSSYVTLLKAVDDGIFCADLNQTYFLAGGDPNKFVLAKRADYGAILGTQTTAFAEKIGGYRGSGRVALWASEYGICLGGNEGVFINLTREHYRIPGQKSGSAIVRNVGDYSQLLITTWE